jgi:hypothetical protein
MGLWQRLLTTFVAMLIASFVIGLASEAWLGFTLPTYAAGVIGGMTALPVWELLKRIRIKDKNKAN